MFKVIETFSGIGSQAQALHNIGIDYNIEATVEWEMAAIYAYDILHNGPQNLKDYRHHSKQSLIQELASYNLSNDGKEVMTERSLSSMSVSYLKAILNSIERNNNLVDITSVHADELPNSNLLTYSFPCQDLSVSGHFHHNKGGIDRNANNRSTLLWEIERLLYEYLDNEKELPQFLLMENVSNILSDKHIDNFKEWQGFLESIGYTNQVITLDARNFGIPQSRIRTYMISVLVDDSNVNQVKDFLNSHNLEKLQWNKQSQPKLSNYLKLNYSNEIYRKEAVESTPYLTPSRKKIFNDNELLAVDRLAFDYKYARTLTTKQDRNPNSGIIGYDHEIITNKNKVYRNLTPRECFLLMGFKEEQFELLVENNFNIGGDRLILPLGKLIKLAGNSIVVPVLEEIFKIIINIKDNILDTNKELILNNVF